MSLSSFQASLASPASAENSVYSSHKKGFGGLDLTGRNVSQKWSIVGLVFTRVPKKLSNRINLVQKGQIRTCYIKSQRIENGHPKLNSKGRLFSRNFLYYIANSSVTFT